MRLIHLLAIIQRFIRFFRFFRLFWFSKLLSSRCILTHFWTWRGRPVLDLALFLRFELFHRGWDSILIILNIHLNLAFRVHHAGFSSFNHIFQIAGISCSLKHIVNPLQSRILIIAAKHLSIGVIHLKIEFFTPLEPLLPKCFHVSNITHWHNL